MASTEKSNSTEAIPDKQSFSITTWLSFVFGLAALLLALYANYQIWHAKTVATADTAMIWQGIKTIEQQRLADKDSNALFKNRLDEVSKTIENAMKERFYQKQDWILLKARYYLELAQMTYLWTDNKALSLLLLRQTDAVLQPLSGQPVLPIRQALAKEIARVEAEPSLDIPGVLSQLDAVQALITELPLTKTALPNAQEEFIADAKLPAWQQQLQKSMQLLKNLVVITHYEDENKPLPTLRALTLQREAIAMNLQEATWAVLHNNDNLFQHSLEQAIKTVSQSFEQNNQVTQSVLTQLQGLKNVRFYKIKPPEDDALLLLNQWIDANQAALEGDKGL